MPKRKKPEDTSEEQFKKFVKIAREHGVDESGEELERAFQHILKAPTPPLSNEKPKLRKTRKYD